MNKHAHLYCIDIDDIRKHLIKLHGKHCKEAAVYIEDVDESETPTGVLIEVQARCMNCSDSKLIYVSSRSYNELQTAFIRH